MTRRHSALITGMVCTLATVLCAPAGATTQYLMIPAAAFSADGTDPSNYNNYGNYLETNATLGFHAWLKLPNASNIVSMDMMTRDDDSNTITMHLKRTKFGFDGASETLLTFASPGSGGCSTDGLCHDMETSLDIAVDAANYTYWFDLSVPDDADQGTDLRFYAVRVGYEVDDVIFADTFESTTTEMWSATSASKALGAKPAHEPDPSSIENRREATLEEMLSTLYVEDPRAHEALEKAIKGQEGYGSPLVIPGPAFKTVGYTEYDDYYFSETLGFVYGRPAGDGDAVMSTGLNLPDGAEVSWYMAFFVDSVRSGTQEDIRFWMSRLHTIDRFSQINMVYETSSGADDGIRSISVNQSSMNAVEPGCTTVDNAQYYYWLTIDVGPYDLSPPDPYQDEEWWHKVYAIVILYTMP